jgi:hypothetical protein
MARVSPFRSKIAPRRAGNSIVRSRCFAASCAYAGASTICSTKSRAPIARNSSVSPMNVQPSRLGDRDPPFFLEEGADRRRFDPLLVDVLFGGAI